MWRKYGIGVLSAKELINKRILRGQLTSLGQKTGIASKIKLLRLAVIRPALRTPSGFVAIIAAVAVCGLITTSGCFSHVSARKDSCTLCKRPPRRPGPPSGARRLCPGHPRLSDQRTNWRALMNLAHGPKSVLQLVPTLLRLSFPRKCMHSRWANNAHLYRFSCAPAWLPSP